MKAWRRDLVIEMEGLRLKLSDDQIEPGDIYVAERNTGPQFLQCERVNKDQGYVVPKLDANGMVGYCYDIRECRKVEGILGAEGLIPNTGGK